MKGPGIIFTFCEGGRDEVEVGIPQELRHLGDGRLLRLVEDPLLVVLGPALLLFLRRFRVVLRRLQIVLRRLKERVN